jgi:uncharacterized membrane protein YheB (UPF0754 family)
MRRKSWKQKLLRKAKERHDRIVKEIFNEPEKYLSESGIEISGKIVEKIIFPRSLKDNKELVDLILLELEEEKKFNLYFIEVKTGVYAKSGKGIDQIQGALRRFLKEWKLWREKISTFDKNPEIPLTLNSVILELNIAELPARLKCFSQKSFRLPFREFSK